MFILHKWNIHSKDNINIKEQQESYFTKMIENTYWVWLVTFNPNKWDLATHCHDSLAKLEEMSGIHIKMMISQWILWNPPFNTLVSCFSL